MLRPVTAFIALRYLRTKRKNRFASFVSIASVLGVALGVAVLIIVASVMNGFEKEVTRHILGMTSHAMLFTPGSSIDDWRTVLEDIKRSPEVAGAAPFIRAGAMLNHRGVVRGITVQGIDADLEPSVTTLADVIGAKNLRSLTTNPSSILLGKSLAQALDADVGDTVTLVAPRWSEKNGVEIPRYIALKVIGTFSVGMHDFDSGIALLDLREAAKVFELDTAVSGFRIRFTDADLAPLGATAIAKRLSNGYTAINWTQYHRNFFHAIKSQKRIMFVILSLIVAVAAFNIVASMVMIVKEKDRDIAVLRTLGLSRTAVMLIFIFQGMLIGLSGVALGIAIGACGANSADRIVAGIERTFDISFIKPDVYYIDYLPADVRLEDIAAISVVAFLICVVATLYPAWRASRTSPALALRYE
ncbi:MAG: lipoprotein-releasing system permease protein [Gammaproteobacteria bacterium]